MILEILRYVYGLRIVQDGGGLSLTSSRINVEEISQYTMHGIMMVKAEISIFICLISMMIYQPSSIGF